MFNMTSCYTVVTFNQKLPPASAAEASGRPATCAGASVSLPSMPNDHSRFNDHSLPINANNCQWSSVTTTMTLWLMETMTTFQCQRITTPKCPVVRTHRTPSATWLWAWPVRLWWSFAWHLAGTCHGCMSHWDGHIGKAAGNHRESCKFSSRKSPESYSFF